ncbi:MAG: hypothetical protein NTV54_03945, partial [Ignavibacteriales bacterium]|nr:hypothetical protein [Ignavibacteriales bacterium]
REPLYYQFRQLLQIDCVASFDRYVRTPDLVPIDLDHKLLEQCSAWTEELQRYFGSHANVSTLLGHLPEDVCIMRRVVQLLSDSERSADTRLTMLNETIAAESSPLLLAWLASHRLSSTEFSLVIQEHGAESAEHLKLEKVLHAHLLIAGISEERSASATELFSVLRVFHNRTADLRSDTLVARMERLLNDFSVREYLRLNWFQGVWYYNREAFSELIDWLFLLTVFHLVENSGLENTVTTEVNKGALIRERLIDISDSVNYDFQKLQEQILEEGLWNID